MSSDEHDLSIGTVVRATGLTEATLRAWERRYGFPTPARGDGGHRRYSDSEVATLKRVIQRRERGVGLRQAIEEARREEPGPRSFYGALHSRFPELAPIAIRKRRLVGLSHAIEDEAASRGERSLLIGGFQRERFFRQAEHRWRELSRTAAQCLAFADFERPRRPDGGPVEIPLAPGEPAVREWVLVSLAPEHAVCLVAWERPGRAPGADDDRLFDALLSLRPEVVREAVAVARTLARDGAPEMADATAELADATVDPAPESQLELAAAITARALSVPS
jgi:DNA-binding transcriptional MerR regulator